MVVATTSTRATPSTVEPPPGFPRYQLVSRLATGGMAEVSLAVMPSDLGPAKPVVIKRLWPELARDPECIQLFLAEVRLSLPLNHPNVIHAYETGHDGDRHFLVLEYLDGQSLKHLLERFNHGPTQTAISLPLALKIVSDVLSGLAYVHALADLVVNAGRKRIEVRPRTGAPLVRWVDAPGGEKVSIRFVRAARKEARANSVDLEDQTGSGISIRDEPAHRPIPLWVPWTATAACAVGAAVAGMLAYRASKDLSDMRRSYPVTQSQLEDKRGTVTIASAVADSLSVAALALGTVSVVMSLDHDNSKPDHRARASLAVAWPATVVVDGHF